MKTTIIVLIIVILGFLGYVVYTKKSEMVTPSPVATSTDTNTHVSLPTTCTDEIQGVPVITSLSAYAGKVGDTLEIRGCSFAGFEGDKNAWIENAQGMKGILYGTASSTSKLVKVKLEAKLCQKDTSYSGAACDAYLNLVPGAYTIYVTPWGTKSNEVKFTIQ